MGFLDYMRTPGHGGLTPADRLSGAFAALASDNPVAAQQAVIRRARADRYADQQIADATDPEERERWELLRHYGLDPRVRGRTRVLTQNLPGGKAQQYLVGPDGTRRPWGEPYDRYREVPRRPMALPVGKDGSGNDVWQYYEEDPETREFTRPRGERFQKKWLDWLESSMRGGGGLDDDLGVIEENPSGDGPTLWDRGAAAAGGALDALRRGASAWYGSPDAEGEEPSDPWAGHEDARKRLNNRYR